ncbi:DUF2339 domain-containing protein [Paenibacillus lentus]|uniref:DUF2339 domain-containing protein n=1 Tax=Paenibacillus lentus TaxID=1338368 RepID=A0A3Q8SDT8_9BACL|nr:DUF2339 domain-containing protein [Paenibacillus lentus]AZK48486.1 DUF2339 domain-containing protein [Paenibacillus lentus]
MDRDKKIIELEEELRKLTQKLHELKSDNELSTKSSDPESESSEMRKAQHSAQARMQDVQQQGQPQGQASDPPNLISQDGQHNQQQQANPYQGIHSEDQQQFRQPQGQPIWNAQDGQQHNQQQQADPYQGMQSEAQQQFRQPHGQPMWNTQEQSMEGQSYVQQPGSSHSASHMRPPSKPSSSRDWEYTLSRVWLPRVFIVVLLFGVLWLFMAAVNAGYLNEPVRCLLGVVLAAAMYWFGDKQVRAQREALGQVVLGGANAVLVLTLFAAHMLYDLLPLGIAFVLYIMSIAFGVFIAVHHRSQTLIIIAMLSGYLIPFLAKSPADPWIFILYEAVFSIAMILVSARFNFRGAYIVAIAVLHVPLLILYVQGYYLKNNWLYLATVLLQHLVLFGITVTRQYRHKLDQMILLPIGFFLLSLWLIELYGSDSSYTFTIVIALLSILYSIATVISYKQKQLSELFASIATYGWVVFIVDSVSNDYRISVLLVLGLLSFILGIKLRSLIQQIVGITLYLFSAFLTLFSLIPAFFSTETLAWILLLISFPIPYFIAKKQQEPKWVLSLWDVFNWAEAVLGLIFLTQIAHVITKSLSSDIYHLSLSGAWILYAAGLILFGLVTNRSRVRLAGVIFLFVILLKVIIIDLPWVSIGVRAILFISLGLAGIFTSRILYQKKQVEDQPMPPDA